MTVVTKKKDELDYIELVKVDPHKLIPYEKNARVHGSEIEFLKNSIGELNLRDPIEVDKDWVVVSGHGRLKAALELGREVVPVIRYKDMDGDEAKLYRLNANKLNDLSTWDWDLVNDEVAELRENGWDMEQFSFEDVSAYDLPTSSEVECESEEEYVEVSEKDPGISEPEFRLMVVCRSLDDRKRAMDMLLEYGFDCQTL